VDRRFNRRKYDAANTVEAFSAQLRNEVDPDTLAAKLLAVIDQTMQPTKASLWLQPSAEIGRVAMERKASHPRRSLTPCMPCSAAPCSQSRSVASAQRNGSLLGLRVRAVLGDHRLVVKRPEGSRQRVGRLELWPASSSSAW
jgi:hypothetical protein